MRIPSPRRRILPKRERGAVGRTLEECLLEQPWTVSDFGPHLGVHLAGDHFPAGKGPSRGVDRVPLRPGGTGPPRLGAPEVSPPEVFAGGSPLDGAAGGPAVRR